MHPIKLLEQELARYTHALDHLETAYTEDKIGSFVYEARKKNLKPLISSYIYAIELLTPYKDKL